MTTDNRYLLVVTVDFEKAIVFIKRVGTQVAYDRINDRKVQRGN